MKSTSECRNPIARAALATAIALSLAAADSLPASAHDFWIEPGSHAPAPGTAIDVALRVGQGFVGEPVPRNAAGIDRFILLGPDGERPIRAPEGAEPAGRARADAPGPYVIGYRSRPVAIDLAAEEFESYLRDEGLEGVIAARAERGESDRPGREIYSRCAKSLLAIGDVPGTVHEAVLGFTLEIVPEKSPAVVPLDQPLGFRLLFRGKPLAGALVFALDRERPALARSMRSDGDGRVRFAMNDRGPWLVKAVHMTAAPPDSGADWESLWASLTFERTPPPTG